MKIYITKDFRIVVVSGAYPKEVLEAQKTLAQFKQVEAGSVWGLDGIAEYVATENKCFRLCKSGISKRQAKQYVKEGKSELID
jgi:hypothetical protein